MSGTSYKKTPKVPAEAIVKHEKPLNTSITPEEIESKDEVEYDRMKSAEHDMDETWTQNYDASLHI